MGRKTLIFREVQGFAPFVSHKIAQCRFHEMNIGLNSSHKNDIVPFYETLGHALRNAAIFLKRGFFMIYCIV